MFHRGRDAALRRPGAVQAPNTFPNPANTTIGSAAARGGDGVARHLYLTYLQGLIAQSVMKSSG